MLNIEKHLDLRPLLQEAKSIAVVGLSPKEARPSNMVARYLIATGYTVYPVNPGQNSILGLHCYSELQEIPDRIDIVNIFRRAEEVHPIVESAIRIGAKAIWMQQGIRNPEAATLAEKNGLIVVMDRCIKVDHMNLFPISS
jgi:predicted CoA-binding protein